MRNTWLIICREYLDKVRTKGFVISTLAMPLIIGLAVLPGKLITLKTDKTHRIAVVSPDRDLAAQVQKQLQQPPGKVDGDQETSSTMFGRYDVEVSTDMSDAGRNLVRERLTRREIDGYIWLRPEDIASRKVTYVRRETGDFIDQSAVRSALSNAIVAQALVHRGVNSAEVSDLLRDVRLEVLQVDHGKESRINTGAAVAAGFSMVLLLYMTVLFYGVAVMRSIVEEKSSRVLEVILSSVTPKQLLAGKIIGVGAVGLTQISIWVSVAAVFLVPQAAASGFLQKAHISFLALAAFPVFFLMGYLLYATMYAALGAILNTEQEGQQMQIIIMLPLIIALSFVLFIIKDPNGAISTWVSMIPFVAPVLMYLRIVVQAPPAWQIALCVALLAGTIYGLLVLCTRIYRVGILMYGKRPTLPEILRWMKYAGE
jgi:ABC-2 type transport system permease protein